MRIDKFELSNYRCFQSTSLKLGPTSVIVGENNVGKSTLLSAIQFAASVPVNQTVAKESWPESNPADPLSVSAEFTFSDGEMERIAFAADFSQGAPKRLDGKQFSQRFGNHLTFSAVWNRPEQAPGFTLALKKDGNQADFTYHFGGFSANQGRVQFGTPAFNEVRNVMSDAFIHFPEFRQRPQASADEAFRAAEGTRVTAVLFSLKNGTKQQQNKYQQIKSHFSKLFPNLKMELTRSGGPAKIMIENAKTGHEVPLDTLGAGIAEMIIMLTHVEGERAKIFAIDEPELHLHPHSQRLLQRVLEASTSLNQVVVVTHSSHFVDLGQLDSLILVRNEGSVSTAIKLPEDYLNLQDRQRISRIVQSEQKEFLFARSVLLVEGPTEYGAMPILARKLGRDFDENGVSIISVGGNYFGLMLKLLQGYGFSSQVMCDRDVVMTISGKIKVDSEDLKASQFFQALHTIGQLHDNELICLREIQESIHKDGDKEVYDDQFFNKLRVIATNREFRILSPDFEGLLAKSGYDRFFQEAEKLYGKNKILQGRYVAEAIDVIPEPIEQVISEVAPQPIETTSS